MGWYIILSIIALCILIIPLLIFKKDDNNRLFSWFSLFPMFVMLVVWLTTLSYCDVATSNITNYNILINLNKDAISNMSYDAIYEIYRKQNIINNAILKNQKNKDSFWNGIWYDKRYENLKMLNI